MKTTTRRLIKQGGGGYTIYLPKKWVDKKGIKRGDDINITDKGSFLIIEGKQNKNKIKTKIKINDKNRKDIKNILTHIYRKGTDIIQFENTDKNINEEIEKITSKWLLGFEITEQTKNSCKIENISAPEGEKYETILKRIFFIIKETHNIINEEFKKNKIKKIKKIKELMINQDKYVLFCKRTLMKELYIKKYPFLQWELLTFLMHIEHAYYYLYKYTHDNKIKITTKMIELFEELNKYFEKLYSAFIKRDVTKIHELNEEKKRLHFGILYELIEKSKGKEAVFYSHLREIFRIIQIGSSPLLSELLEEE